MFSVCLLCAPQFHVRQPCMALLFWETPGSCERLSRGFFVAVDLSKA